MTNSITILYILCPSQSGSTLLSLLLGNQPQLVCAGELNIFAQSPERRQRLRALRCSCDQLPWQVCEFWSAIDHYLQQHHQLSLAELDVEAKEATIFHQHNKWLYEAIKAVSGKSIIVDSSKMIIRFTRLRAAGFRVVPIRLQRKPLAVVYSWIKRGAQWHPEDRGHQWWNVAEHYTTFYKTLNKVTSNDPPYRISYDQLAQQPAMTLRQLLDQLGLDSTDLQLDWSQQKYHHLSGNPMRYQRNPTIEADDRWRNGLRPAQQKAILFITLPTLLDVRWLYLLWKYPIRAFLRMRALFFGLKDEEQRPSANRSATGLRNNDRL